MLVGIIIGAVVLLLIIFVISSYNKLVKQKVNVEGICYDGCLFKKAF